MRFAAWNCCGRGSQAAAYLASLDVDVAVLSEVDQVAEAPFDQWETVGDYPNKYLALASTTASLNNPETAEGRWSIRATHESGVGVLGLWANSTKGTDQRHYAAEARQAIESSASFLASQPCIIAGDLNMFSHAKEFEPILSQLSALGYASLHHHLSGDPLPRSPKNSESPATFYQYRHQDKPFHIDYIFVAEALLPRVRDFRIGTFEETVKGPGEPDSISDHVPLMMTLDL